METNFSKFKIYGTLLALGCAGGSIYIIPYIRYVFYDLQLEVSGMSNVQAAFLLTALAMVAMVINTPVGIIIDKLNLKTSIMLALIVTTAFTILYAFTFQSYIMSLIIWISFAVTTTVYWMAFSKILNIVGAKTDKTGTGKSGMAFGIYYAFNGISAAIINAISLWSSTRFTDPFSAFRMPVFMAAVGTIVACIMVWFLMDNELVNLAEQAKKAEKEAGSNIKEVKEKGQLLTVIKNPMVWVVTIVCMVGYLLYSLQGYFTPYLTNVVGISPAESGIFAIIRTYIFLILAAFGGFMADKVFKSTSKWMGVAFAIMAVVVAGFFIMPEGMPAMLLGAYTLLPSAFVQMTYTIKYSTINETGIPANLLATTTGVISTVSALVDVAFSPFVAWCIDTKGNAAYDILFGILIVALVIGSISAFIIASKNKKRIENEKRAV